MTESFYEKPILNSPYEVPHFHHALDRDGQPLDLPPVEGRRRSEFITPVPKPRKKKPKAEQGALDLDTNTVEAKEQKYNPTPIINEMRSHVASWRGLPSAADWGVTPTTARVLAHWRGDRFESVRPFFCQVEAVETVIWLTEVARNQGRYAKFWEHIRGANEEANPELVRIAMKMATGSGKTTVMASRMGKDWSPMPRKSPLARTEITSAAVKQHASKFMQSLASLGYLLFQSPGFRPSVYSTGFPTGIANESEDERVSPLSRVVRVSDSGNSVNTVMPHRMLEWSSGRYGCAGVNDNSMRPCSQPNRQQRAEGIASRRAPHFRRQMLPLLRPAANKSWPQSIVDMRR